MAFAPRFGEGRIKECPYVFVRAVPQVSTGLREQDCRPQSGRPRLARVRAPAQELTGRGIDGTAVARLLAQDELR